MPSRTRSSDLPASMPAVCANGSSRRCCRSSPGNHSRGCEEDAIPAEAGARIGGHRNPLPAVSGCQDTASLVMECDGGIERLPAQQDAAARPYLAVPWIPQIAEVDDR